MLWGSGIGPLLRCLREPRLIAVAYHRISDMPHHLTITPAMFGQHIAYLQKRGYVFIPFRDLSAQAGLAGDCQISKKAALYFDDGFRDLPEMDIPATFFLTPDYLDQKNGHDYLTWQEAALLKTGGEIGSHTVTHRKLTKMPLAEAREEMARSKQMLEERFGIEITSFSYPKGRSSPTLEALAREVGYTITTADKRFHKARPDPNESLSVFKLKLLDFL